MLDFYRKVYWLDEGNTGIPRKVASVNMDGSDPQIILKDDLQQVGRIAIDIENQVLYWTQPSGQKVSNKWSTLIFYNLGLSSNFLKKIFRWPHFEISENVM